MLDLDKSIKSVTLITVCVNTLRTRFTSVTVEVIGFGFFLRNIRLEVSISSCKICVKDVACSVDLVHDVCVHIYSV